MAQIRLFFLGSKTHQDLLSIPGIIVKTFTVGWIKGCKYRSSSWHLNGFPDGNSIGSTVLCRGEAHRYTYTVIIIIIIINGTLARSLEPMVTECTFTLIARLPILLVVSSWTGKMNYSLSSLAPENLVSRDGFGGPISRQLAHLHTPG